VGWSITDKLILSTATLKKTVFYNKNIFFKTNKKKKKKTLFFIILTSKTNPIGGWNEEASGWQKPFRLFPFIC